MSTFTLTFDLLFICFIPWFFLFLFLLFYFSVFVTIKQISIVGIWVCYMRINLLNRFFNRCFNIFPIECDDPFGLRQFKSIVVGGGLYLFDVNISFGHCLCLEGCLFGFWIFADMFILPRTLLVDPFNCLIIVIFIVTLFTIVILILIEVLM